MTVGERGQITIPKALRERFGLAPGADVEFAVVDDTLVLRKARRKLDLSKWKGYCRESFAELGDQGVDEFIEDVRGR